MFPNKDNINNIKKYVEEGYISKKPHKNLPYFVYNYTPKCQYESFWNEETLNCRGLVLDENNKIIARGMKKFFNYGEYGEDSKLGELPAYKGFDVYEKYDGSLIIMTDDRDGNRIILTRGSFDSEQAIVANEILKEKYGKLKDINPKLTYLFEIIYKSNRIVVDYGDKRDLVLLTVVDNSTGQDIPRNHIESFARTWKFPLVNKFNFDSLNDITKIMGYVDCCNEEGYVIRFDTGLRVKMKYDEYVRLHRLITGVNTKAIWESLRDGKSLDELLDRVPDEFNKWVKKTIKSYKSKYEKIEKESKKIIEGAVPPLSEIERKEVAKYFQKKKHKKYKSVLFAMYDDKEYDKIIWKMIRPKYAKPFKEEI